MSAAATWRNLGQALMAGLGSPTLGLVVQGHVPAATAWPVRGTVRGSSGRATVPAHTSQHCLAAQVGAPTARYAGGQP